MLFPCPTPFHLPPALSYFYFKFYLLPFLTCFLTPMLIILPPSLLSKLVFFTLDISKSFFFLIILLFSFYLYQSLFHCYGHHWGDFLLQFHSYFSLFFSSNPHIILFPCLTPVYSLSSLFYLCGEFYFLLFFALFLFPTVIISPLSLTLSKSFFFLLVTSHYFFLSYNITILFAPL